MQKLQFTTGTWGYSILAHTSIRTYKDHVGPCLLLARDSLVTAPWLSDVGVSV